MKLYTIRELAALLTHELDVSQDLKNHVIKELIRGGIGLIESQLSIAIKNTSVERIGNKYQIKYS